MNKRILHNRELLTYIGSEWGGLYVDINSIEEESTIISAGLGGDISFDEELTALKKSKIIGIDPTAISIKAVGASILENRLSSTYIHIKKALLGESNKSVKLGGPAVTFLSPHGEDATSITLNDIFKICPTTIDFLKLDIEAAEFDVINSLDNIPNIKQIGVSFHHWLNGPTDQYPNPGVICPYSLEDTVRCIKKIKKSGYKLINIDNADPLRYFQEVLFLKDGLSSVYKDIQFEYKGTII